jgi:hypothetical protein
MLPDMMVWNGMKEMSSRKIQIQVLLIKKKLTKEALRKKDGGLE